MDTERELFLLDSKEIKYTSGRMKIAPSEFVTVAKPITRSIRGLRYHVLAIATLIAALPLSCQVAFTVALTCNIDLNMNKTDVYENDTSNSPIMYFPKVKENLMLSAFPFGIVIMLPALSLLASVTVRTQVFIGALLIGVLTLLFPPLYDYYPRTLVYTKILHGMATAPTVPLIGFVSSRWAPLKEIGLFVGTLTCFSQIAVMFSMSTSGIMCTSFGWRWIFYSHGIVMMVISFLWFIIFRDDPEQHRRLSMQEKKQIMDGKGGESETKSVNEEPIWRLFTNKSVIGILIAGIGTYNGITPLICFFPLILKNALNSTMFEITIYPTMSVLMQTVFKIASGVLSDRWTSASERFKLGFFNTISCGITGLLMIATPFLPAENKMACSIMLVATQALIGFNSASFNRAAILVAGKKAPVIITVLGLSFFLAIIYEPFIVGAVAPDNSWDQWFWLFIGHGSILFLSNIFFCLLTDGKPANFSR